MRYQVPFLESLVWLDLRLNTSRPAHWRTLYHCLLSLKTSEISRHFQSEQIVRSFKWPGYFVQIICEWNITSSHGDNLVALMVKGLDSRIVVSDFNLQSRYLQVVITFKQKFYKASVLLAWWLECSPRAQETWVQSQVESYQRLQKWYLMPPCLTLSIIRYWSRVKWRNPRKI